MLWTDPGAPLAAKKAALQIEILCLLKEGRQEEAHMQWCLLKSLQSLADAEAIVGFTIELN